jgi:hypothetical protein
LYHAVLMEVKTDGRKITRLVKNLRGKAAR